MSETKGTSATTPVAATKEQAATTRSSPALDKVVLTATDSADARPAVNPNSPTLVLEKPSVGQAVTIVWIVGTPIDFKFDLAAAKIVAADGSTTFVFTDGATLKVVGLEIGSQGLPETPVTLADGAVIGLDDIGGLSGIAPGAGGAPGVSPGAGGQPGNQGHAVTPADPGDLGAGLLDTGALRYTDLSFSVPELEGDNVENILDEGEDAITIAINDVTVTEGDPIDGGEGNGNGEGGDPRFLDDPTTTITFTVTLSAPSDTPVTVNYTVVPGTAVPGVPGDGEGDYNGGFGAAFQVGEGLFKLADNATTPSANFVGGEPSTGFQSGTYTFSESGTVLLAWGTFNEGDNIVDSPFLLDNLRLNGALLEDFDDATLNALFNTAAGFQGAQTSNFNGVAPTQGAGLFSFTPDGTGASSAADIETLLGLPPGSLSQLANDGDGSNGTENATFGSVLFVTLTVSAGDTLSFDFDHIAADGNGPGANFNDFSFFSSSLAGTLETTNAQGIDPLSGTITFAPGETSKTVTLNIIDDFLPENTETFTVVLSDPVGAGIADDTGVGTILDDDLTLSINDATATEGDPLEGGDGHFLLGDNASEDVPQIYRVELDGTVSVAVSNAEIAAAVLAGGAQTGASFELNESGIAEDAAGNIFFSVDGVGFFGGGDGEAFFNQNPIFVKLAATGDIQLVANPFVITGVTDGQSDPEDLVIAPDGTLYFVNQPEFFDDNSGDSDILKVIDPLGTPEISLVTSGFVMSEAVADEFGGILNEFKTDVGITVSADGSTLFVPFDAEIEIDGEGGTESVGGVFAINAATGAIENIFTHPDMTGPEYITLAPNGDLIVADEDSDQIYRFNPNNGDDPGSVFVSKAQIQAVTDEPDLEGGIAFDQFGNFYVADEDSSTVIKFPAVDPVQGTIDVINGSKFIQQGDLSAISGATPELNSDLTFVPGGGGASGDDPNTTITFTVTLSAASNQAVTVGYTVVPGTAVEGNPLTHEGDYSPIDALTGTVTFAAGETSKTITLNVVDDLLAESTENFTVVLSNPVGADIVDGTGVGTILDNDEGGLVLSISDATAIEGDVLTFNLTLSAVSAATIVVSLNSNDGSAEEGADFQGIDGQLVTFLPGQTQKSVSVTSLEDGVFEGDETFTVTASAVTGQVDTTDTGTGTITDDEAAPTVSINDVTVAEGGTAQFTVTLSGPADQDIVLNFTTADDTAKDGVGESGAGIPDYTAQSGSVTILAGQTAATATINVSTTNDNAVEDTETFNVTLTPSSGPLAGAGNDFTGVGTITDDDASISLSISDDTAFEGDELTFLLALSEASTETIVVELNSTDGSAGFVAATENTDYASLDGQLVTFNPGETSKSVTITTFEDGVFEPTEALTISASALQGAVNTTDTGRGLISDDDPVPSLTISNATAAEGNQLVFNLTLSTPSSENLVFEFQTSNGQAIEGTDFTSGDGKRVTFLAGQTTGAVTIDTIEDTLVEPTEEMNITATVVPGSGTALVANFAEGFITNDDFGPLGGQGSGSVLEAGVEGNAPDGEGGLTPGVFPTGSDPASNSEIASGSLNLSFGEDGPAASGAFIWSSTVTVVDSDDGNAPVSLTSDGFPVVTQVSANGLTLDFVVNGGPDAGQVIARLTATPGAGPNAGANFSYEQFGNFDHPDEGQSGAADPLALGFSYTIKDASGDTANGTLAVSVGDDAPSGAIAKSATLTSGANAFNLAFVLDVSDSMDDTVDGGGTRLELALQALNNLLNQADDAGAAGPVLIVAFHGAKAGSVTAPRVEATSFANVGAAIAGLEDFIFNEVLAGQTPPLPSFPNPLGGTLYEGGLDAAADWLRGADVTGVTHDPINVAQADNRVFLLTDGGNNSGLGGFNSTFANVEDLYTNIGTLANDIPNLTIRSVGIDMDQAAEEAELSVNSDATPAEIAERLALFTRDLDQSDDNVINGSIALVESSQGAGAIAGGFGIVNADGEITGNLLVDDDGNGFETGSDGLGGLQSFTILNGAGGADDVTVTALDGTGGIVTRSTALGGTIEVNFNTGAFTYTAPPGLVTSVDGFTFLVGDGDGDPLNGTLNINLAPGGTIFSNAGFETDTLRFWSAAGSVWVTDGEGLGSAGIPGQSEGSFFAALHTGNDNALTPSADRDIPSDTEIESFIGGTLDLDALIGGVNARDGAALKGSFELNPSASGKFDVSFDWQFLSDEGITADGPNDMAFVVIEGQLFLLANSDNAGAPEALVADLAGAGLTFDGQLFANGTAFVDDQTFSGITDVGNDGIVNIAFGVLNGGTATGSSSALIIDDVEVVPHVVAP